MLTLDVLLAPNDGSSRTTNPEKDAVICVTCQLSMMGHEEGATPPPAAGNAGAGGMAGAAGEGRGSMSFHSSSSSSSSSGGGRGPSRVPGKRVAFILAGTAAGAAAASGANAGGSGSGGYGPLECEGMEVWLFGREEDLLLAWHEWFLAVDPDALAVFQVRGWEWEVFLEKGLAGEGDGGGGGR